MARTDPQVNIRLPVELKEKLEASAQRSQRAFKAEIVARLERTFAIDRANAEAAGRIARGEQPEIIPAPESEDDYGVVRTVSGDEGQQSQVFTTETIDDALARSVREAIDNSMAKYLENAREGQRAVRAWFEEATASLTPDGPEAQQLLDDLRARVSAPDDNEGKARSRSAK